MYTVLHAFQEPDGKGQDLHLRYWYGTVRPDSEPEAVCWCGAKHVRISEDTIAVWHVRNYYAGAVDG